MKVAENQRWLQALVLALPRQKRPRKILSCVWEHTVKIDVKEMGCIWTLLKWLWIVCSGD
jgi:hypothetical protein